MCVCENHSPSRACSPNESPVKMFYDGKKDRTSLQGTYGNSRPCFLPLERSKSCRHLSLPQRGGNGPVFVQLTSPYLLGTGCNEIRSQIPVTGKTALWGFHCSDETSSKLSGTAVIVARKLWGYWNQPHYFRKAHLIATVNHHHLSYVKLLWNYIIWKPFDENPTVFTFLPIKSTWGFWKNRAKRKANTALFFNKYLLTYMSFRARTKMPHWKQLCELGPLSQCLWVSERLERTPLGPVSRWSTESWKQC